MIKLMYHGDMQTAAGKGDECEAADVKQVMNFIKTKHGAKTYKIAKSMLIVVNGTSMLLLDGYKTKLNAGDEVAFLPVCGGG